ncbi:MAG: signal peptidase I [Lactobacillaceae bacterium]|jgi:signal peptidase I|nr:signal peptidase I [Lactobacillaceae bacterium]
MNSIKKIIQNKSFKNIIEWIIPIAIGLTVAIIIRLFLVVPVTVSGDSMFPNLHDKERTFAFLPAQIKRGSVVAFDARAEDPGIQPGQKYYIKRVIGIPGDTVKAENGKLFVNGKEVNQEYLDKSQKNAGTGNWDLTLLSSGNSEWTTTTSHWNDKKANKVPANSYFVLGDNRAESEDSRYFGFVSKKHILGVDYKYPWASNKKEVNSQWKEFFAK